MFSEAVFISAESKFFCNLCSRQNIVPLNAEEHSIKVSQSPNGLVPYIGFHRCRSGMLNVTEVYVDANHASRSFKQITLPSIGFRKKVAVPGLPVPSSPTPANTEGFKTIKIPKLPSDEQIRIHIMDYGFNTSIEIGEIDHEKDTAITLITSDMGTIALYFYPSDVQFSTSIEKWFSIFLNSLETLLPSTLGLIIDVLLYIIQTRNQHPRDFETKMVKTILVSYEVYFEILKDDAIDYINSFLAQKYEAKDIQMMGSLVSHIQDNPHLPMINYAKTHHNNLVHLIYLFLILEMEEVIQINRPGIVELA